MMFRFSSDVRRHLIFLLATLFLIAVSWADIRSLADYASNPGNINASQVFLIPFISAALIFLKRNRIFSQVRFSVMPGVIGVVGGLGFWLAGHLWGRQLVEGDRLALTTAGIITLWLAAFLFCYGEAAFKTALFPLLFLAFALPIPSVILDPLTSFLQRGSAEISYLMLKVSGTPIYREGNVFLMPRMPPIEVAPECSGIRSCISMLILTILAGNQLLGTWWRRLVLVLVALPIMVFKNALRITTLALLSVYVDPRIIESRLHREGGIPFFVIALLLLLPVLTALIRTERRNRKEVGVPTSVPDGATAS